MVQGVGFECSSYWTKGLKPNWLNTMNFQRMGLRTRCQTKPQSLYMVGCGWTNEEMGSSLKCCPRVFRPRSLILFFFYFQYQVPVVFQDHADYCSFLPFLSSSPFFVIPHSWRVALIIYFFLVDLDPPSVDCAGHYLSARSISHLPKPSVSCGNQGRTVQGVLSSLMRLGRQLGALNVKVTAFPRTAPTPYPRVRPTVLILSLRNALGGCL